MVLSDDLHFTIAMSLKFKEEVEIPSPLNNGG